MGSEKERRFDVRFSEQNSTFNCGGGGSGTTNYEKLKNKPSINGVQLYGNKTGDELGLVGQDSFDAIVEDLSFEDARLHASTVSDLAPVTKRVPGGTKLCNQLRMEAGCVQLGFSVTEDDEKLHIYGAFVYAFDSKPLNHVEYYFLRSDKNVTTAPIELTIDSAPYIQQITHGPRESLHKVRVNISDLWNSGGHTDVRMYARIVGDNNEILDEFYSSQYRYTIANGIAQRTRLKTTASQDPHYIIDIGLVRATDSVSDTFGNIFAASDQDYLPIVSTPEQDVQYSFIVPDSMFINNYPLIVAVRRGDGVTHFGPAFYKAEEPVDPEELEPIRDNIKVLQGDIVTASAPVVKRVSEGTKIINQLKILKGCFVAGYYYDSTSLIFDIYTFFGCSTIIAPRCTFYYLTAKNSESQPYEFTIENAPKISVAATGNDYRKGRIETNNCVNGTILDLRLCVIAYDNNNNEIERFYSDQYRYTITNGSVVRTHVATAAQEVNAVTDIGLDAPTTSISLTCNMISKTYYDLMPVVTTYQTYQYAYIIPDDRFIGYPYGLTFCIRMSNGYTYEGFTFEKAPEEHPALPAGGSIGDILVKASNSDYDATWETIPNASGVNF